jgi:outer membrane protein OmpA-like peptidoglycan-associated protein
MRSVHGFKSWCDIASHGSSLKLWATLALSITMILTLVGGLSTAYGSEKLPYTEGAQEKINICTEHALDEKCVCGARGFGGKRFATSNGLDSSLASVSLIYFSRNSASLNSTAKAKLDAIAELAGTAAGDVTVKSFELTGKNRVTKALATKRATTMLDYLKSRGVSNAQAAVTRGTTAIQSRASLVTFSPSVLGAQLASEKVDSLIVRYMSGVKPSAKTPITGSDKVTTVAKRELTLGKYLGLRMYQVDFRTPVDIAIASKVADQMTKSRFVEFAEPNGIVTTQVTVN